MAAAVKPLLVVNGMPSIAGCAWTCGLRMRSAPKTKLALGLMAYGAFEGDTRHRE